MACSALLSGRGARTNEVLPEAASVAVVVKGAKSAKVRTAVERILDDRYDLVSTRLYQKTARRLRATKMKARNVAKVATRLGIDAVIDASLKRSGNKRYKLVVRIRDGATGKTLDKFTMALRSRKLRRGDRDEIAAKLYPKLDDYSIIEVDDAAAEPEEAVATNADDAPDVEPIEPEPAAAKPTKRAERESRIATVAANEQGKAKAKPAPRKPAPVAKAKPAPRQPAPVAKAKPAPRKPAAAKAEPEDDGEATVYEKVEFDDEGQAIDDEVPTALKKR